MRAAIDFPASGIRLKDELRRVTRELVVEALKRSGGNKAGAARLLGISRTHVVEYAYRFGLPLNAPYSPKQRPRKRWEGWE